MIIFKIFHCKQQIIEVESGIMSYSVFARSCKIHKNGAVTLVCNGNVVNIDVASGLCPLHIVWIWCVAGLFIQTPCYLI
jgi:hypothetical protein